MTGWSPSRSPYITSSTRCRFRVGPVPVFPSPSHPRSSAMEVSGGDARVQAGAPFLVLVSAIARPPQARQLSHDRCQCSATAIISATWASGHIIFYDDLFHGEAQAVVELFARAFHRRGFPVHLECHIPRTSRRRYSRADKRAGCWQIAYGIESRARSASLTSSSTMCPAAYARDSAHTPPPASAPMLHLIGHPTETI